MRTMTVMGVLIEIAPGSLAFSQNGKACFDPSVANYDGVMNGGMTILLSLLESGVVIPDAALKEAMEQLLTEASGTEE